MTHIDDILYAPIKKNDATRSLDQSNGRPVTNITITAIGSGYSAGDAVTILNWQPRTFAELIQQQASQWGWGPRYEVVAQTFLNTGDGQGTRLIQPGQTITYAGIPNKALKPLDPQAEREYQRVCHTWGH
jgi:hypothetical protein